MQFSHPPDLSIRKQVGEHENLGPVVQSIVSLTSSLSVLQLYNQIH